MKSSAGFFLIVLLLASTLAACAPKSSEVRGKVHCPACNNEIDAVFQKSF